MKHLPIHAVALAALLGLAGTGRSTAQNLEDAAQPAETIRLEGRAIEASDRAAQEPTGTRVGAWVRDRLTGPQPYIVRLKTTDMGEAQAAISGLGGAIVSSDIAGAAFLVRLDERQRGQVEALPQVDWVRRFQPEEKLGSALEILQKHAESSAAAAEGPGSATAVLASSFRIGSSLNVIIVLYPGEVYESVAEALKDAAAVRRVEVGDSLKILATLPMSAVERIARLPQVRLVDLDLPHTVQNDIAGTLIGIPELVGSTLTGDGQVIGHADTGLDNGAMDASLHDDFEGKLRGVWGWGRPGSGPEDPGTWSDLDGHGTHTAATLVGTGRASGKVYRGIAPGALLFHQSLAKPSGELETANPGKLFEQAYRNDARVHSDSWGINALGILLGYGGIYRFDAEEVDTWAWNRGQPRDMLIVCAAGNFGPKPKTVGAPGTAKNCLTVGATGNGRREARADAVADFSSRGPTAEGRIKPDVVAPGSWIASARTQAANTPWRHDFEDLGNWQVPAPFLWAEDDFHSGRRSIRFQEPAGSSYLRSLELPGSIELPAEPPLRLALSVKGTLPRGCHLRAAFRSPPQILERVDVVHAGTFPGWTTFHVLVPASFRGVNTRIALEIQADDPTDAVTDLRIDDVHVTTFSSRGALSDLAIVPLDDPVDRLYTLLSGTSMSTPVVAGAAALVRESLMKHQGVPAPKAELIKAILINGAHSLGSAARPDSDQGWGLINLPRSLPGNGRSFLYEQDRAVSDEETASVSFRVTDPSQELRITLVWCDPPGGGLQHNLDAVIHPPQGEPLYPFGASAGSPDRTNNVEGVDIAGPAVGAWRVDVTGRPIRNGSQPFALVISGAVERISTGDSHD